MEKAEKWIWLDKQKYPDYQTTIYSGLLEKKEKGNFTVAEFDKEYCFDEEVIQADLRFSADTEFHLYFNGGFLANGPVNVGGDSLYNEMPRSKHYASEITVYPDAFRLHFFARVKMMPCADNEYSRGRGGFMLWAKLRFKNGRVKYITTDRTWMVRRNHAYIGAYCYDQRLDTDVFSPAAEVENIWHTQTAPLKLRMERKVYPINKEAVKVLPGETKEFTFDFDRIYAGFVFVEVKTRGEVFVQLECLETDTAFRTYQLTFQESGNYPGVQLNSIGTYRVRMENHSEEEAFLEAYIIETHYPVSVDAATYTSDADLNLVLKVCKHTLKICRQMIHLDSPKHSEPLCCTGDYYIESLMTAMSFGDMALAEMDVIRTAELLRMHDGRMFHTSYSLIWVMMLWDVYCIGGNKNMLYECADALSILLERFEAYTGENGLLENCPDYMFVDWIYIDGFSLHHPPKALGQTSLCAFYYGALMSAVKIYDVLEERAESRHCLKVADKLKEAVNRLLYDKEKGLYFDGLNTPTPQEKVYQYLPQNTQKRYYMPHSNILCTCFGICEKGAARRILKKVAEDKKWGVCQPYFKHFLLEAIYRNGLREEYTLEVLDDWKEPVRACAKGLVEGFVTPEPGYHFDHSHAWGGTPLYFLPKALIGLEILEPAYRKIRISPNLLGLESAHVEIPTPVGIMQFDLEKGRETKMNIPEGIEAEVVF